MFATSIIERRSAVVVALALFTFVGACGEQGSAIESAMPPPTKKLSDLKQGQTEMSAEELAAARREAGFRSREEVAAENAALFEKGAREYIKTRTKQYRAHLGDLRKAIDELEAEAKKWPTAKDPQKAFDQYATKYKQKVDALTKTYDELTGKGAEGGNTQAILGKAFRTWEDVNASLGPELAKNEQFAAALTEIRKGLDEVLAAVEAIEKDESLVANKFFEEGAAEGQAADGGAH